MVWVSITPDTIWDVLPPAVKAQWEAFNGWVEYDGSPDGLVHTKAEWFETNFPAYRATFRSAIAAVPNATPDPDETKLPWPLILSFAAYMAYGMAAATAQSWPNQPENAIPAAIATAYADAQAALANLSYQLFTPSTQAEAWISVTPKSIATEIPSDVWTLWQTLLTTKPSKEIWLYEMLSGTVQEFRDAIATNPENTLDTDTTKIPSSCLRPLMILFTNAMLNEMGADVTPERRQAAIRAEMFLRQISYSRFSVMAKDVRKSTTPAYKPPAWKEQNQERSLP